VFRKFAELHSVRQVLPGNDINWARVSPDGAWMAINGSFQGVLVVDTGTRGVKRRLEVPAQVAC
jgi:hypothetical protein